MKRKELKLNICLYDNKRFVGNKRKRKKEKEGT